LDNPWDVAVDGSGNIWVTNNSDSGVSKFSSSTGNPLSPASGYTGGGLSSGSLSGGGGTQIAIDGSGNVWLTNVVSVRLAEFSTAGAPLSPASGYTAGGGLENPDSLAIDGSGDVWIANAGTNSVTEIIGIATPVVTPLVANLISPYSVPASKP
jgi:streptogramin lyase